MKNTKKANVLVYTIILTLIAVTLSAIIFSNYTNLILNQKSVELEKKLYNNINFKLSLFYKKELEVNNDWSWFIDNYKWSWANIKCRLQADWTYFVEWDSGSVLWSDGIDDNCNSDNFLWNNSWSQNYPDNFEDNDNYTRKNLDWVVFPGLEKNIFWNNFKINKFIDNNSNNTDIFNKKIWDTQSWALHLKINTGAIIQVIKFDRNQYQNFNKLRKLETITWSLNSWSWYLQKSWNNIIFGSNLANAYNFDFKNNDYALFLKNLDNSTILNYNLYWKEITSGSWVYINPIDDSKNNIIEFLGYDIIKNEFWNLVWKIIKFIKKK